jgi:hypothetical protein
VLSNGKFAAIFLQMGANGRVGIGRLERSCDDCLNVFGTVGKVEWGHD